jgi:type II secretory pathway pseudopilin PulG
MRSAKADGFTLVEVLAAGTILTVWGAVLAVSVRQSMRSLDAAGRVDTAAELIDETLTKIDVIGPAALYAEGPTAGQFAPPHDQYAWQVEIVPLTDGDLYDVAVTVSWRDALGRVRQADAETLLNDPPGGRPAGLHWGSM